MAHKGEGESVGAGESFERVATQVGKRGHEAIDHVADAVHRGASQVKTGIEGPLERAREKAGELREKKVGDIVEDVRDVVRRHPGKAIAAAAAAGFLFAVWLRRRD